MTVPIFPRFPLRVLIGRFDIGGFGAGDIGGQPVSGCETGATSSVVWFWFRGPLLPCGGDVQRMILKLVYMGVILSRGVLIVSLYRVL